MDVFEVLDFEYRYKSLKMGTLWNFENILIQKIESIVLNWESFLHVNDFELRPCWDEWIL